MANTKVTQHVIANNAITADQLASAAVTDAKLHSTLDLSGKTLTLPATTIPSASTATTQAASDNSTKLATTAYVTTAIGNLVDSAPTALDTLNELAAALGDDANFSATITTALGTKLPLAGGTLTGDLVLSGAPTSGLHPATKTYVDTADALKLNLSGGTLTGDLILNTTTALQIPVGTTGQRPTAATGQIRWNSTDGAIEVYNGTAWTAVGTGSSNKILDTFTGDNSTTDFTLSVTPANEDALMVFIDGAYQEAGDYVLTNNVLALDTAPLTGEKISAHIITATVHDGTSSVNNQFTATAGQTAFTLTQDPKSENNTQVYINGVYQQKTDYTVTGTTLTFDTGLTVGDVVEVNMFTVATLGNTDTVTEGVGNLYHTTARAREAISVSGNAISYNSSTGVITSAYEESPTFTGTVTATDLTLSDSTNPTLTITDTTNPTSLILKSGNLSTTIGNTTNHPLTFDTNNIERMRIDESGNVVIENTNPGATLHVKGSGQFDMLTIERTSSTPGIKFVSGGDTSGTFGFQLMDNNEWWSGVYDGSNYDYWIQSSSDALRVKKPVSSFTDSGTKQYSHLCTGSFYQSTGYLVIHTNIPGHNQSGNANMITFKIRGYEYGVFGAIDMNVGAYCGENNYYSPCYNGTYVPEGWRDNIQMATDSNGKLALILGTSTTVHRIEMAVTDFIHGYQNVNESYAKGWTMAHETSLSGYSGNTNLLARMSSPRPAFHAYLGTTTAYSAGVVKRVLGSTTYNDGGHYNTSNGKFTAPTKGIYQFNMALQLQSSTTTQTYASAEIIVNNGQRYIGGWFEKTGNAYGAATGSVTVKLDRDDYVEFQTELSSTTSALGGSAGYTYLSGAQIG